MGHDLACQLPSINLLSLDLPLPRLQYYPVYYDQNVPRQPLLIGGLVHAVHPLGVSSGVVNAAMSLAPLGLVGPSSISHGGPISVGASPATIGGASFVASQAAQVTPAAPVAMLVPMGHMSAIAQVSAPVALPNVKREVPTIVAPRALPEPSSRAAGFSGLTSLAVAAAANDSLVPPHQYLQNHSRSHSPNHAITQDTTKPQNQTHSPDHHSSYHKHVHHSDPETKNISNSVSAASSAVSLPSTSALSLDLAGHELAPKGHSAALSTPTSPKSPEKDWKPRKKRQCPECHLYFSNLATHKSTHLKPTSRPHVCKLCHRGFARPNDLFRHFKCHWKEIGADNGQFRCPFKSGPHGDHCCHTLGIFSRCDTYKNHLKAIHFQYPSGTKKSQRNQVPGNCRLCHAQFRNVDEWIATHIDAHQCPYGMK
ncbi:CIC11C00000005292 [Sungouiella intermedia]|uniref:CIC11C00000005292 n=1 Tax=Sungouiella intermedia TaxID=45354 RepID=A0A1L0D475_9ASCO|nr:CIC11C00000005292 [[Candida] intermedia]